MVLLSLVEIGKVGFFSFVVTFLLVPLFCWGSQRYALVDIPDGVVKKHAHPVPNVGGLAVYIGFISTCFWFYLCRDQLLLYALGGSTLFLITGLIDDRRALTPGQKFLLQCIGALFLVVKGVFAHVSFLPEVITIPFSFLWILTLANAFNLIDIMDGLATTVALCIAGMLITILLSLNISMLTLVLAALIGSLIAFLYYNKSPASLYLGDAGALFLGSFLSIIPFLFSWTTYNPYGYLIPFSVFAIPLYELLALIIIRTYKKIPFYLPSPDHFCLYLLQYGWSKDQILWYVLTVSLGIGLISLLFFITVLSLLQFSVLCLLLLCLWIFFLTGRTV